MSLCRGVAQAKQLRWTTHGSLAGHADSTCRGIFEWLVLREGRVLDVLTTMETEWRALLFKLVPLIFMAV